MKNEKEDLLYMTPVRNYEAPQLPTLEDSRDNPTLLKKLPLRWQKKAAVIACMSFVGTITLSGCAYAHLLDNRIHHGGAVGAPIYVANPTEQETSGVIQPQPDNIQAALEAAELELRTHSGGSGFGPIYVVHITEQEALGIIRAQLEAAGLNFNAVPPDYTVETWYRDFSFDLYDEERGVAITHLSWEDNNQHFFSHGGSDLAQQITEAFAEQAKDISVGVFFNPGESLGMSQDWRGWEDEEWSEGMEYEPPTAERKEEAKAMLIERLTAQVQAFIDFLRAEGVV